ncbi:hypothetical protein V1264_023920 [Littorina saxatilis]|uniref:EGF-like domain-containing protein n=2 Tax=Littorina saxatilis TaxID=31220 RepID=A0AAN9GBT0_9CAEN
MEYFSFNIVLLLSFFTLCFSSQQCNWAGSYHSNRCQCYEGFTGTNCDTDCHCEGHGVCKADGTCECGTGWKWSASHHKCVWDCNCHGGVQCIGPGECGCAHTCKWGACRNGQCVCYEGYKGDDCSHYDRNIMQNKDVKMAVNIARVAHYSSEVKWVDIAKQSKTPWLTQRDGVHQWNTNEIDKVSLRTDGYPAWLPAGLRVGTLVYNLFGEHQQQGNYTLLYDGEGTVDFHLADHLVHYRSKGRIVVELSKFPHDGLEIMITETNPKNPLHNLRLIAPGYENTYLRFPFHPLFLEKLKRFSEIRFMSFLSTNFHVLDPTTWDSRKLTTYHTQAGENGAALEYVVQIANWVGADPWVNIPHLADANYVKQFAAFVKQHLRPDLKVYVEFSNEMWGSGSAKARYALQKGQVLFPGDDMETAGTKYFLKRATEVAHIWSQIWSGHDKQRLVNVLSGHSQDTAAFDHMMQLLGDRKSSFQALSMQDYFNCQWIAGSQPQQFMNMTMSQIKHYCDLDLVKHKNNDHHYMGVAKAHGLQLVMYEGGPAVRNPKYVAGVTAKAHAFNRDPLMRNAVKDILEAWYNIVTSKGGGPFNYFVSTDIPMEDGQSWGMTEYTGQDLHTAPKWLAVQTFISDHWPNSQLGPKCSFVRDQTTSTVYGCFLSGGHYVCAKSADNGHSWTNIFSLNQGDKYHVTLDGYDVKAKKLFMRLTDRTAVNTYHVYSDHTHHWTKLPGFQYFTEEFSPSVVPRIPTAGDTRLDSFQHCWD